MYICIHTYVSLGMHIIKCVVLALLSLLLNYIYAYVCIVYFMEP